MNSPASSWAMNMSNVYLTSSAVRSSPSLHVRPSRRVNTPVTVPSAFSVISASWARSSGNHEVVGGDAVAGPPTGAGASTTAMLRLFSGSSRCRSGGSCSCAHTNVPPAAPAGVEPSVPGVVPRCRAWCLRCRAWCPRCRARCPCSRARCPRKGRRWRRVRAGGVVVVTAGGEGRVTRRRPEPGAGGSSWSCSRNSPPHGIDGGR